MDAIKGVPQETRQALTGGYTTFERILPGPDRMYPDTDSPPTRITAERVAEARSRLRPPPWERFAKYGALRVPRETTEFLIRRGGAQIVDAVVEKTGVDGLVAAIEIGQRAKAMKRAGIPMERLGTAEWVQVFDLFTGGRIPREAIQPVAAHMAKNPGVDAAAASANLGFVLQDRAAWTRGAATALLDGGLPHRSGPIPTGSGCGISSARPSVNSAARPPPKTWPSIVKTRLRQEVLQ